MTQRHIVSYRKTRTFSNIAVSLPFDGEMPTGETSFRIRALLMLETIR